VGLYVNKNSPESSELIRIPPSRHPEQLRHILEALALIQPIETMPIARLVVSESRNLPWGSTLLVITAVPTEPLLAALFHLQRVGRKVVLITIGGSAPISNNGLTTYHVDGDVPWEKLESLKLGARC
jgi:uncharacterized protein (DUF58 family)